MNKSIVIGLIYFYPRSLNRTLLLHQLNTNEKPKITKSCRKEINMLKKQSTLTEKNDVNTPRKSESNALKIEG